MTNITLPDHIFCAFLKKCKSVILMHYIGDRFQIWDDWADKGRQGYVYIFSGSASDDTQKGLRELRKLVKSGLLTERARLSRSEACRFALADKDLKRSLLRHAYDHWRNTGYSVDKITERRH